MKKSFLFLLLSLISIQVNALTLAIQPVYGAEKTKQVFKPLVKFLENTTNEKVELVTYDNYFTFWIKTRNANHDFVMAAAHMTDWLKMNKQYSPMIKPEGTISYSIYAHNSIDVFELSETTNNSFGVVNSPNLGGLILAKMFTEASEYQAGEPLIKIYKTIESVVDGFNNKQVQLAIVPTRMTAQLEDGYLVTQSSNFPHVALSANSEASKKFSSIIRANVFTNIVAINLLNELKMGNFTNCDPDIYNNYASYLPY